MCSSSIEKQALRLFSRLKTRKIFTRDVKAGINSTEGNNVHTRVVNKILQHNAKEVSDTRSPIKMLRMLKLSGYF